MNNDEFSWLEWLDRHGKKIAWAMFLGAFVYASVLLAFLLYTISLIE